MHGFLSNPAMTIALALLFGALAQALGRQVRIPGIVLLLLVGVLLGPDVANLVRPETLGHGLELLVGFAVAVILFEGGLNLDLARLGKTHRALTRLVTVGAVVTALGASLAARLCMGWSWELSALFGSLVIVTGPTVIGPLVRRLRINHRTSALLEGEGVIIDPIGAITAFIVLECVLAPTLHHGVMSFSHLGLGLILGGLLGLAGGACLSLAIRTPWLVPRGLERATTLAAVLLLYQGADAIVPESGIAAVTVAGITVRWFQGPRHEELREFKEQLTILMIGMLFVLLAASVSVHEVQALGWRGLLTVLVLIFIVRPLCVFVSTRGTSLSGRERLFLAWIGPRGIVAAAVASLFATRLTAAGIPGGAELRALTFLVIACTVILAGFTGGLVARSLGLRREVDKGWLVLGAHALARSFARELQRNGEEVVLLDRNRHDCLTAYEEGFTVVHGNALDEQNLERAAVDTRRGAVALTRNDEANLLFVARCHELGKLERLAITLSEDEAGVTDDMIAKAECDVLGCRGFNVKWWDQQIERGEASIQWWVVHDGMSSEDLLGVDERGPLFAPLMSRRGGAVRLTPPRAGDELALLINDARVDEVRARLQALGLRELREAAEVVPLAGAGDERHAA